MSKASKKSSYARAGVDIDEMMTGLAAVKKMVKKTAVSGTLSNIGSFGGLFAAPGKDHALVASTDGVGTKLKVAMMAGRHKTVGQDLVNHCVNDILVQGAKPLFFLDYIGTARLKGSIFRDVVSGLCKACRENGCTLLGGETAEMPGLYPAGEYDLVGTIVGTVEKKKIITGSGIRRGDVIIGLRSSGLHTNGYSLARKVLFEKLKLKTKSLVPGSRRTVAAALLAVHKSYLNPVSRVMKKVRVRGMAHITGGGLVDNIPRVLPENTCAEIDTSAWSVPAIFNIIEKHGRVDSREMYRVFNMGIGFTLVVRSADVDDTLKVLRNSGEPGKVIGKIVKGTGSVVLK